MRSLLIILFSLSLALNAQSDDVSYFNDTSFQSKDSLAAFYKNKALDLYYQHHFSKSLVYGLEALKIYEKLADSSQIAWTYNLIGSVYSSQNKNERARSFLRQGFRIAKAIKDTKGVIRAINNLGTSYAEDLATDTALQYLKGGLTWSQQILDTGNIARFYYNIATYYSTLNEYALTLKYLDTSIAYCRLIPDSFQVAIRYDLYAFALLERKKYAKSIIYNNRSLKIYSDLNDTTSVANIYNKLGRAYLKFGNTRKALTNLKVAERLKDATENYYLSDTYGFIHQVLSKEKRYQEAYQVLLLQQHYEDSVQLARESKQWESLELVEEYERLKLNQEKASLKLVQERQSEQERQYILVLILAIGIVIILIVFLIKLRNGNRKMQDQQISIFEKNALLKESIQEKEVLLKEIHHRVKNNLQMISSMLGMQEMLVDDEDVRQVLEQGQSRIQAMALIHQQLYQSEQLGNIDILEYLDNLIGYLQQVNTSDCEVDILLDLAEDVKLDIDDVIPLGLIISEVISNCYKYAFENQNSGEIKIDLNKNSENAYLLVLRDNGVGYPENFNVSSSKSLGMKLIQILTHQIGGEFNCFNENGAIVEIHFKQ